MNAKHTWKFFRAGGFDQVKLETGADLANLDKLDQLRERLKNYSNSHG